MRLVFLRVATFPLVLLAAGTAYANGCKSLAQSACGSAPQCTWVSGYERSDGKQVQAYCRKARTPAASATVTPKSTAKGT